MSGMLQAGRVETIVHTWLPRLMEHLHDAYPGLMVEIQVDTTTVLKAQLASRQIDLAFLLGPMEEPRVENLYLCNYPLSWVASPSSRSAASRSRSGGWPNGPSSPIPPPPIRTARHCRCCCRPVWSRRMYGSSALSVIVRMALDGIGTALIAPVILRELAQGELRILDVKDGEVPPLHYTACWMQGRTARCRARWPGGAADCTREEAQRHPA